VCVSGQYGVILSSLAALRGYMVLDAAACRRRVARQVRRHRAMKMNEFPVIVNSLPDKRLLRLLWARFTISANKAISNSSFVYVHWP